MPCISHGSIRLATPSLSKGSVDDVGLHTQLHATLKTLCSTAGSPFAIVKPVPLFPLLTAGVPPQVCGLPASSGGEKGAGWGCAPQPPFLQRPSTAAPCASTKLLLLAVELRSFCKRLPAQSDDAARPSPHLYMGSGRSAASVLPLLLGVRDVLQLAHFLVAQAPYFGSDQIAVTGQLRAWKSHLECKVLIGISVGGSRETFFAWSPMWPFGPR